jgi:hypothetical protein
MADKKISELTAVTTPTASNPLAIVNAGATKKVTLTNLGGAGAYFDANKVQGVSVWATAPNAGELLRYNGTSTQYESLPPTANDYRLDQIDNPTVDKTFNMSNKKLKYTFNNPSAGTAGAFEIEGIGAFSGDLIHIHQHIGNPGAVNLISLEAEDADAQGIVIDVVNTAGIVNNQQYVSSLANTAPFVITATAVNTNLNADLLDGSHKTDAEFNANEIQSVTVGTAAPSAGQILKYNGTSSQYEATADNSGNGGLTGQTVAISGATATPDFSLGNNIEISVNGNFTLDASNITANKWGYIHFTQDATGGHTISYAANTFKFTGSQGAVLSSTGGSIDVFEWFTDTSTAAIFVSPAKNFGFAS